jgi:hypothetical protein
MHLALPYRQGASTVGAILRSIRSCGRKSLLYLALLGALAISLTAAAQHVQQRPLPPKASQGTLGEPHEFPTVKIDNRTLRLSPGARIFDQSNRTIVHAQLPPGAEVLYTSDAAGNIQRMYILTEEELLRLKQAGRR